MTAFVLRAISWPMEKRSSHEVTPVSSVNGLARLREFLHLLLMVLLFSCAEAPSVFAQSPPRTIHVFVALADNKNQGIVPVAAILGDGDDPKHNLYWGSSYGVKTYFARSADWQLIASGQRPKPEILERCIFKHRSQNVYLVADAYQGKQIKQAIVDFLDSAAGGAAEDVPVKLGGEAVILKAGGGADLVAYAGHDGLMDFQLTTLPQRKSKSSRQAIILACISKSYFSAPLHATGATPLVWTTGLMAPEAYTLKSAFDGWILHESDEQIRERAAVAYDRYQKCGLKGARRLLVTGW
jgi:hypothetical protein